MRNFGLENSIKKLDFVIKNKNSSETGFIFENIAQQCWAKLKNDVEKINTQIWTRSLAKEANEIRF